MSAGDLDGLVAAAGIEQPIPLLHRTKAVGEDPVHQSTHIVAVPSACLELPVETELPLKREGAGRAPVLCSRQEVGDTIHHWKDVLAAAASKRAFEQFLRITSDRLRDLEAAPAERTTYDVQQVESHDVRPNGVASRYRLTVASRSYTHSQAAVQLERVRRPVGDRRLAVGIGSTILPHGRDGALIRAQSRRAQGERKVPVPHFDMTVAGSCSRTISLRDGHMVEDVRR